jgi:hypothetical protein
MRCAVGPRPAILISDDRDEFVATTHERRGHASRSLDTADREAGLVKLGGEQVLIERVGDAYKTG